MIYDFSYKTGSNFGSLSSQKKDTCIEESYLSNLILSSKEISGINSTILSLNGQTLTEQTAILYPTSFENIYLNSGDYYFKSGETYRDVSFNDTLPITGMKSRNFFYNLKDQNIETPFGTGELDLNNKIALKFPARTGTITGLESFDYFSNGQKIYSGTPNPSYRITGSIPKFYYKESNTGIISAIPKNTGLKNTTGVSPDIYGQKYVESTVFAYINGLALNKKNWLELSTGVILIKSGLQSSIFESPQENYTLQL